MNALEIIEYLDNHGVTLWADGEDIGYRGDMSVITTSVIEQLRNNKQDILQLLNEPSQSFDHLPMDWQIALSILEEMTAEKRAQMVYDKAPVNILRREWRKRYQMALSLNDWETERLEQDLRFNQYVHFNGMLETVERTTPEFEAKALEFIIWAENKGIKYQFLTIPTGLINDGRIRTLPADTVSGLDEYMKQHS